MKLLFIGGTGLISSACSELAVKRGHELFILTRGVSAKHPIPKGATLLRSDVQAADVAAISRLLGGMRFDAVVDFLAFQPKDIDRDVSSLQGRTDQFVFISSASAYQKPPRDYLLDEQTPLANPYWQYSRDKIACEARLMQAHDEQGFPATIVRPSLTYGPSQIPFCVGSWAHPWTIMDRMQRGGKIIVPGDGTSLWVLTWNADFAVGLLGLLGNASAIGEAFHITSDEVLTWDQIYLEAFEALGMTPNILHVASDLIAAYWPHALGSLLGDKMHSVVFNNAKIKRAVPGFSCPTKWADGLRRAMQWHELHPQFKTIDNELDETMDRIVQAHAALSTSAR
jgi:nucleoside-diphosphate-sugar epimerase